MSIPDEPITRKEKYLAAAAGQAIDNLPDPVTREEMYLDAIARGAGGGGTGGSTVTKSKTNGNIVVNGAEMGVYDDTEVRQEIDKNAGEIAAMDFDKADRTELQEYVTALEKDIVNLQDLIGIGYDNASVVGVQVDFEQKTFKRIAAAEGLTDGKDFDKFNMYGGRKRCNVLDDGTITAYWGEEGYAKDGSNGQVMVYQPKFYYKMVPLKLEPQTGNGKGYHIRKANYYVSDTKVTGFKVHPAFINAKGEEVDYILIGAYEGCLYDVSENAYVVNDSQVMNVTEDKFSSIANAKPASGLTQLLTRPNIEQMCQNRGSNWHEENIQIVSMTQLLMLIEYGVFDFQRVLGKGVVDIQDNQNYNCAAITGSTFDLGNDSGAAKITYGNIGDESYQNNVDGKVSISYRGQENPYGNIWKFVMGINIWGNSSMNGGEAYICTDYNYAESKNTDNYKGVGFTLPNNSSYISAFGYGNKEFDWIFLPSEAIGGTNALPVGDNEYVTANSNGFRISLLGGGVSIGWNAGGFCWHQHNVVGYRARTVSGRLAFIPNSEVSI